jgi:hypothetical protein
LIDRHQRFRNVKRPEEEKMSTSDTKKKKIASFADGEQSDKNINLCEWNWMTTLMCCAAKIIPGHQLKILQPICTIEMLPTWYKNISPPMIFYKLFSLQFEIPHESLQFRCQHLICVAYIKCQHNFFVWWKT